MWQKVKFKTLNRSAYYCRKTDNKCLNWVHLSSTLCHTMRGFFWDVWTWSSMSAISKNSWRPFSSTMQTHRSVCCALICDVCEYSPTWVQIVHKTRNSSFYSTKTNKKSVQTEFISLVPYDTQHDLTADIHSDAIMASKQKCL